MKNIIATLGFLALLGVNSVASAAPMDSKSFTLDPTFKGKFSDGSAQKGAKAACEKQCTALFPGIDKKENAAADNKCVSCCKNAQFDAKDYVKFNYVTDHSGKSSCDTKKP